MNPSGLILDLLPTTFAVALLDPGARIPVWAEGNDLVSVTRTQSELSVVCQESAVPPEVESQRGFRCLRVSGPLDFFECGILASLASPLADSGTSIFTLSTYRTDYLFIQGKDLASAIAALSAAGHTIRRLDPA
jgi:hypothetical protein